MVVGTTRGDQVMLVCKVQVERSSRLGEMGRREALHSIDSTSNHFLHHFFSLFEQPRMGQRGNSSELVDQLDRFFRRHIASSHITTGQ